MSISTDKPLTDGAQGVFWPGFFAYLVKRIYKLSYWKAQTLKLTTRKLFSLRKNAGQNAPPGGLSATHVCVKSAVVSFNNKFVDTAAPTISDIINIHYSLLIITRQDCINVFQIFSHIFEFQIKNILRIYRLSKTRKKHRALTKNTIFLWKSV